ncbi:hypothetical protein GCK32_012632, partial [Trichostrongylus colubriformis]
VERRLCLHLDMEYVAIEAITNGVMNLKDYFLVDALETAFWADSVATSHPLSFKIDRAVERYLKKFSYGNARSQDLWDALDTVTTNVKGPDGNRLSMKEFADQWTVQVSLSGICSQENLSL